MKSLLIALVILISVTQVQAANIYATNVDDGTTSAQSCRVSDRDEPSADITYYENGKEVRRPIYSDLCGPSAQWIVRVYRNALGFIVAIGEGNSFKADAMITVSNLWLGEIHKEGSESGGIVGVVDEPNKSPKDLEGKK